jgi:hypothetical protein
MRNLPVDLSELELAFESRGADLDLHANWFDTQTGEVIFLTEDLEEQDEVRQQAEEDTGERFIPIEPDH